MKLNDTSPVAATTSGCVWCARADDADVKSGSVWRALIAGVGVGVDNDVAVACERCVKWSEDVCTA
jgi:hypothetical protein